VLVEGNIAVLIQMVVALIYSNPMIVALISFKKYYLIKLRNLTQFK